MASSKWWSEKTVAVVTGAGKGIGLEIVKGLASEGITVVITLRDEGAATALARQLADEHGIQVRSHALDITAPESVEAFAGWIRDTFDQGIDILVNNAGLMLHPVHHNLEEAKTVFEVNYYGTKRVTEAMLPLLKASDAGARIVNLSTLGARLDVLGNDWQRKLLDLDALSEETVDAFVSAYLADVERGEQFRKGWPEVFGRTDYCVAKMALNAYSRVLAKKVAAEGRKIFVNCTSPGHTKCVMSGHTGHSPLEGSLTAVWLALESAPPLTSGDYFIKKRSVGFVQIPLAHFEELIYDVEEIKKHLMENANYTRHK